jgi:hypothetical protein
MIVTYRPDGGDERTWTYVPDDLPYAEAEQLEDVLGCTFDEFKGKVIAGGAKARRALLWVLMRRDSPKLRFSDVQLSRTGELVVEFEAPEIQKLREGVLRNDDLDEDARNGVLKALDEMEFDGIAAAHAGSPDPKEDPGPLPGKG